jgi:uncharacterized radical SAM superfamily protein
MSSLLEQYKLKMTITQKRKILQQIVDIEKDISELKRVRNEIAKNGYASATLSSGGGSKSYTRLDLSKISETIKQLTIELKQLRQIIDNGNQKPLWKTTLVIYS